MIKYFVFIFFVFVTTATFAQNDAKLNNKEISKISYVIKGGLNLSNIQFNSGEEFSSEDLKPKTGFHFGIIAEYPVSKRVAFGTGLLLSSKGTKSNIENTNNGDISESSSTLNLLYLEIPLTAKTYFNVGQSKIYGALGPYISLGIGGKSKGEVTFRGETKKYVEDVNWGSSQDDDFKSLDCGLTTGAGIEIGSIQIGMTYNLGITNISPITENDIKIKNRVFGLSIGYKFGMK